MEVLSKADYFTSALIYETLTGKYCLILVHLILLLMLISLLSDHLKDLFIVASFSYFEFLSTMQKGICIKNGSA